MAERCGQQNTADAFSIGALTRRAYDQRLTLSLSEQEVVGDRRDLSLPSLRTDSVNRGFCISLLMLATVVLSDFLDLLIFFMDDKINFLFVIFLDLIDSQDFFGFVLLGFAAALVALEHFHIDHKALYSGRQR